MSIPRAWPAVCGISREREERRTPSPMKWREVYRVVKGRTTAVVGRMLVGYGGVVIELEAWW